MNMLQLLFSFVASAAFAVLFHVPKGTLLQSGFVGMIGWLVYLLLVRFVHEPILPTLVASFCVAVLSQLFAKIYKTPITIFSISGIIPLVPGGVAYDAMRKVVENQYAAAVQLGAKALMLAGAIAMGLVFSEAVNHLIRKSRL